MHTGQLFTPQTNVPNSLAMLEALPYFEGRSLILAQKYKARKEYLAGRHVKKSRKLDEDFTLRSTFLTPKAVKFLQNKVYTKRKTSLRVDLVTNV